MLLADWVYNVHQVGLFLMKPLAFWAVSFTCLAAMLCVAADAGTVTVAPDKRDAVGGAAR